MGIVYRCEKILQPIQQCKGLSVRLWSTESWKQLASLRFDSPEINALSFSPDGNSLVAGGGRNGRVAIPARSGRPARPGLGEVRIWELAQLIQK